MISPGLYQNSFEITSFGKINFENTVTFKTGHSIILTNGFHARAGCEFTAKIEYCRTPPEALNVAELETEQRIIKGQRI